MMISKDNVKIRTRNSTDWKLLKNRCKESLPCDDSDNEGAFAPADAVSVDRSRELWQDQESPEKILAQWKRNLGTEQSSQDQIDQVLS